MIDYKKLLFVCTYNRGRSATASVVFSGYEEIDVASAGIHRRAQAHVTPQFIEWADIIMVMQAKHLWHLRLKYWRQLRGKRLICLHVPDRYNFMDPKLVTRLKKGVLPILEEELKRELKTPSPEADDEQFAYAKKHAVPQSMFA